MSLNEILKFLLTWISINTNYDTSKFDFPINIVQPRVIQDMVCGGKCPVIAFFSESKGIFISDMNFKDICNQSILLHEIIHSFQVDSDMEEVFKEKEAYELQNKFLEELSLKNDMIKILNVKKCRSNQLMNKLLSGVKNE